MRNSRRTERAFALLAALAATSLAPRSVLAQVPNLFGGEEFSSEGPNCYAFKLKRPPAW